MSEPEDDFMPFNEADRGEPMTHQQLAAAYDRMQAAFDAPAPPLDEAAIDSEWRAARTPDQEAAWANRWAEPLMDALAAERLARERAERARDELYRELESVAIVECCICYVTGPCYFDREAWICCNTVHAKARAALAPAQPAADEEWYVRTDVQQWNDISGAWHHLVQADPTKQPAAEEE